MREAGLAELTGNVLPFWSTVAVDAVRGGIHGAVGNDLQVDDSVPRTAVICARWLWAFSAAGRVLSEGSYLDVADAAYEYFVEHMSDHLHGGVFWSVDMNGEVVDDRKQIYAQAFAVYALSEYSRARGLTGPLTRAEAIFELIETHGADGAQGGYIEACARDWSGVDDMRLSARDLNAPKSMNTLLHVMEAYTALLNVSGDERVRLRLADLVTTILDKVVDLDAGTMRLFFDLNWTPLSKTISYGHDIEGAWLIAAAARAVGEPQLVDRAERAALALADVVYRSGRDAQGAIFYEHRPESDGVPAWTDRESHWWAQAEGVVGFLEAYRISGEARFFEGARACWRVIEQFHVDRANGDWFKVLDVQRRPKASSPKVGPWECPYHHVRACLELIERLPVALPIQGGPNE